MSNNDPMKYPHNVLEGFGNGCILDLRARIALDLLKSPMYETCGDCEPAEIAKHALAVATEVMAQAESMGYVKPLPENSELSVPLKKQAARTAAFQVEQQLSGQAYAEDAARHKIQTAGSPVLPAANSAH